MSQSDNKSQWATGSGGQAVKTPVQNTRNRRHNNSKPYNTHNLTGRGDVNPT